MTGPGSRAPPLSVDGRGRNAAVRLREHDRVEELHRGDQCLDDPPRLTGTLEPSGYTTRKAAADMAPRELTAHRGPMKLREIFGRPEWSRDFDCKGERTRT